MHTAEELPDDVALLKKRIIEQASRIKQQDLTIAYLELKLARLLQRRVSANIVQADDNQLLFSFVHELAEKTGDAVVDAVAKANEAPANGPAKGTHNEPNSSREPKPGRKRLPPELPRIETKYELKEDERAAVSRCSRLERLSPRSWRA